MSFIYKKYTRGSDCSKATQLNIAEYNYILREYCMLKVFHDRLNVTGTFVFILRLLLRYRATISYVISRICIVNKWTKSFSMSASYIYKKNIIIKQIHIIPTLRGPRAVLYFDLSRITIAHSNELFVSIIRSFTYRILPFLLTFIRF